MSRDRESDPQLWRGHVPALARWVHTRAAIQADGGIGADGYLWLASASALDEVRVS